MAHLFEPLKLRDVVLHNRIGMPSMCQYSAHDGIANDWHDVHYRSRAVGGAALINLEATAVAPAGRISPRDLGLWNDEQIEPLARIARFAKAQHCALGIQLAHAGRKASGGTGWQPARTLSADEGGWPVVGPSPISFGEGYAVPQQLSIEQINEVIAQFAASTWRALDAGFNVVEIHGAHGYLLHQFLSPLANQRTDNYGGSFENRTRLVREVIAAVRSEWPERLPLLLRLSATDWVAGGWDAEQTVELCRAVKSLGVDLVDVSSGGLASGARMPIGPGYQTEFAAQVRHQAGIPTSAVGLITSPEQADHIVRSGQADLVLIGRELLRDPYWPLAAARQLGHATAWPEQYLRAGPAGSTAR